MAKNAALASYYAQLCSGTSDIVEHLPTFVHTVEDLKATKVIEIGVRYGVSTIAWLYALEGKGNLWAVDCSFPVATTAYYDESGHMQFHPGSGLDAVNLLDPQTPGGIGVLDHWIFMLGDCHAPMIRNALPRDVDIIFLDTNHVYGETLMELEMYRPLVRKGGRILLHDTAIESTANSTNPDDPKYPVLTAVREFCEKHNLKYTNQTNCNGLGTIYC